MQQIGSALGLGQRKERQPVRRGSHRRGDCEHGFWRRTEKREARGIVLEARRYDLVERQPGRRNGPLGHIALEVLDLLANLVDRCSGRLEPSYEYLGAKLKRSRGAIARALKALCNHGFVDKLRRYEATGNEGERGPQVRQVSNAYRLTRPAKARRLLGRIMGHPPLPDDEAQRRDECEAEVAAFKLALPLDELPLALVDDATLGRLLAVMGQRIQDRKRAAQEREFT